jgi:hypothetical protein
MKKFLLCFFLSLAALSAAEPAKVFALVELRDGRVLKNVTLANPTKTTVLLRQSNGPSVLVAYEFLPETVADAADAIRPGGPAPREKGAKAGAAKREITGQVFVTTRGAGAYKFSGVTVYAFPMSAWETWANTNVNPVELPRPLAKTVTDGDGRFTLKVAEGTPCFVFAQASRLAGSQHEENEWHVPVKGDGPVLLNNSNLYGSFRPVKIE